MLPFVQLSGNLTKDPELRFTAGGKAVASFTVACNERKLKDGQWTDGQATFVQCTVWDQVAEELLEKTSKGSAVTVTGRLVQRSYETQEGEKRTVFEVRVDQLAITLKGSQGSRSTPSKLDDDDPWANPAF